MPQRKIQIKSILPGISPSRFYASEGQFLGSIGIDPDYPISSSDVRTSGVIVPTRYEKFSGSNVNSPVIKIINTPKNALTYVVTANGKLISYDSSLGSETLIGTVSGGVANGAEYYNNYIYIAGTTDISRYGPLDGVAALTDGVWTGATLGSQTALTNTTYPSLRGVTLPNHWMMTHIDSALYFVDFKNGQGLVHKIKTVRGAVDGDTNSGSTYAILRLPLSTSNFPTSLCSYSTDIAIIAMATNDTTVNQGRSSLFLWDALNAAPTAYRQIAISDPMATAIYDYYGSPVIWSGNAQGGVRISRYLGGQVLKQMAFFEEGIAPLQDAISCTGNRLVWGGYTTYPGNSACVFSLGSKNDDLQMGLHNIIKTTSSGSNQIVTSIKMVQQANGSTPRWAVAWRDGSAQGVDKLSTSATFSSTFVSAQYQVENNFIIRRIRIPLGATVTTNMSIAPKVLYDDGTSTTTLTTINSTNFSGQKTIVYKANDIGSTVGQTNFSIELDFAGSVSLPVEFPIEIVLDIIDD